MSETLEAKEGEPERLLSVKVAFCNGLSVLFQLDVRHCCGRLWVIMLAVRDGQVALLVLVAAEVVWLADVTVAEAVVMSPYRNGATRMYCMARKVDSSSVACT